jgi:prophage regulatory protein
MSNESERIVEIVRPWYLTRKQLILITGLSRDTIDRLERRGEFPKRIVLSGRKVCWDLQEIQNWDRERKAAREGSLC